MTSCLSYLSTSNLFFSDSSSSIHLTKECISSLSGFCLFVCFCYQKSNSEPCICQASTQPLSCKSFLSEDHFWPCHYFSEKLLVCPYFSALILTAYVKMLLLNIKILFSLLQISFFIFFAASSNSLLPCTTNILSSLYLKFFFFHSCTEVLSILQSTPERHFYKTSLLYPSSENNTL